VVPHNTSSTVLARLLDLERSGGYQVDQQARFNLDLIPQYGGTVGGFRRSAAMLWGGFHPSRMAEDTDMTFRLYTRGFRVAYANRVECYEQVPQEWEARFKQLRRWSRGHTQALFHHFIPVIKSPHLNFAEKADALLLLGVYMVPPLIVSAVLTNLYLFLDGATPVGPNLALSFFVVLYGAFGNFAPFYQIGVAGLLDGMRERLRLLPFLFLLFMYNALAVTCGVCDAIVDLTRNRHPEWDKTVRFTT
jgi:cellulose synthase/poly-beta-1,6-N-acetylglucosamine synthase-like glycosyltransferase